MTMEPDMTRMREEPGATKECRTCKAKIVWAKSSSTGRPMPMDLEPNTEGQFFMFRKTDCIEAVHCRERSTRAEEARTRGDKKYTCHFATCAQADQHRRPR